MSVSRIGQTIRNIVLLGILAGGGWLVWQNRARISQFRLNASSTKAAATDQLVCEAKEGPLTISVTESGTIKPREQVIIKNEVEGRTTLLYLIPEGRQVSKGELLVELDVSTLVDERVDQEIRVQNAEASFIESRENLEVVKNQAKSDVSKAELELRFAKEDLSKYEEGEYPNELKDLEARITLAEEELQRAKDKLAWSKVLFEEKYLAETELKADELSAKKAELDLELAKNKLDLLKDYTYKRNIDELKSAVEQAEMALERTQRRTAADIVQAEAQLRARESEFRRQKAKLEKCSEQIAKGKILAPMDGVVVYATSAKASWRGNEEPLAEGQEIRERQELIYLPTADTFMAEIKVHESSLDKVVAGLPVRLTVDALPGRSFDGTVHRIAPLPDAQSAFMNPDLKVYRTEIYVNGGGDVLKTGMSCRAEVIVDHYPSAIYVPLQCVVRIGGKPSVFVPSEAGYEARTVEVGLDNNSMVRILSGLAAGDKVLLTPPLEQVSVASSGHISSEELSQLEDAGRKAREAKTVPRNGDPPPTPPGNNGADAGDGEPRRPPGGGERGQMTPEQMQKFRERMEKMTPEEREEMRKRWAEGRGRPRPPQAGGPEGGTRSERGPRGE